VTEVKNDDLAMIKLVDGSFAIGKCTLIERSEEEGGGADIFVVDAYTLMLKRAPNGEVGVAIADFMAPFIQNTEGAIFAEKDWIGLPHPMPVELQADYLRKKTGIVTPQRSSIIQP
jgi:hypothetical protein